MAPASKLTAFLALSAASPYCDAFAPSPRLQHRQATVELSAREQDDNAMVDGWRKASGGAAAFLTGMGIMAQVAMADPSAIAPIDAATMAHAQSSTVSSNVLLSSGAPSFGGGSSFDTLDFSLPSYDQANGAGLTKTPDDGPSAAASESNADKAEAKRAAEEEKAANKQAEADARVAKKQAEADAKQFEADAKQAAEDEKAAKATAKQERLAAEKEKQRLAVESNKAFTEGAVSAPTPSPVDSLKDIKVPDIKVPDIKVPDIKVPAMPDMKSFSMPKVDMPKMDFKMPDIPEIKVPDVPKPAASVDIKAPEMPKFDVPKMPAFSLPKIDIPDAPKFDIPATPKFDMPATPKFDMPTPAASSFDDNLEPQEIRDARAAATNDSYNEAQAEAKEAMKAAKVAQNKANDAKKVFKAAKGEACVTRPGGKLLCLRGFGAGY